LLRELLGERDDLLRILDWNFETPPFYLESAYGGPNLIRWSHELRQLEPLGRAERIELFLQIAAAVAAAHRVGVLHKDLKPANILVMALPAGGFRPGLPTLAAAGCSSPSGWRGWALRDSA
jgi:eukaryotic-like serine/threonine-protein kinase